MASLEEDEDLYTVLSEADRVRLCYNILTKIKLAEMGQTSAIFSTKQYSHCDINEKFLDFLKRHKLYDDIQPLHSRSRMIKKMQDFKLAQRDGFEYDPTATLLSRSLKQRFAPVGLIRDYYGDEIAVYYEWMNFFLRWISVPAASAVLIRILNSLFFEQSQSPLNALFAIGMSYWAALFSINWNKHERGLRIQWNNLYHTEMNVEQIREEFVGEPTINPITEVMEPDYPDHKRRLMYIQSAVICAPCFAVVFVFLVACYNVTGVITAEKHGNIFVIPELAALAEEGALFDANSNMGFVTSIVQVVLTLLLNLQFRQIARWCTERENHKYQSSFDNSLIIKRFVFEFFDCFLPLMYFGWWELNFKVLRQNVISLYVVDELRRVACESLIPYLTQNSEKIKNKLKITLSIQKKQKEEELVKAAAGSGNEAAVDEHLAHLIEIEELEELQKEELEIFDDYIEMVVTFGYITMFASAFTLGAACIFVFIMIEARSDIFRLEQTLKRPIPAKTHHIGSWSGLIQLFCFLSVFSNIIVSCYASDQMDHLLPWLSEYRDDEKTSVVTVFCLEHFMLVSTMALKLWLDKDPKWCEIFMARRATRHEREAMQRVQTLAAGSTTTAQ